MSLARRQLVAIVSGLAALSVAAGLGVAMLVGGSGGGVGPLGATPGGGMGCTPMGSHSALTVGGADFANPTRRPMTISSFSLIAPHHLRLLGVFLVRVVEAHGTYNLVGNSFGFPPSAAHIPPDAQWARRRSLPTTISPTKTGSDWNIVYGLGVTGGAHLAFDKSWKLRYRSAGHSYVLIGGIDDVLLGHHQSCPNTLPGS